MYKKLLAILMLIFSFSVMAKDKLKIGVTLQPYYSFVVNTVKDKAEVIPVVRLDKYDSHSYQPKPEDIIKRDTAISPTFIPKNFSPKNNGALLSA